jgi:Holliday junction resolvase RusA-like endonuclease
MTVLKLIEEYRGGKGFVTTDQVLPTTGTLLAPATFWIAGQPIPKTGEREPKALGGWQSTVRDISRQKKMESGKTGAFQPVSVILQFSTDANDRLDMLCRSTLDALTHAGLIHDDSNIVDLVATVRPCSQSPTGAAGVAVTVIPGELIYGDVKRYVGGLVTGGVVRSVYEHPRTMPDKSKKTAVSVGYQKWVIALENLYRKNEIPGDKATLICDFKLVRWLEPEGVHYPIVNGRDVDKLAKSVIAYAGLKNVTDIIASKRLSEDTGARISLIDGSALTSSRMGELAGFYNGVHGNWSEAGKPTC